jgi:hypothetical protein
MQEPNGVVTVSPEDLISSSGLATVSAALVTSIAALQRGGHVLFRYGQVGLVGGWTPGLSCSL